MSKPLPSRLLPIVLTALMFASTTFAIGVTNFSPTAEDFPSAEGTILNEAQSDALERVVGRSSITNWVRSVGPDTSASNGPGSYNSVHIESMVPDHSGQNIIVVGTLRGDVTFDSIDPPAQDGPRAFVGKLSNFGSWSWVSMATVPHGGAGGSFGSDLAVTSTGDIWVVGSFWDEIEWGSHIELSDGSKDGFVAKMDSSGGWKWGLTMGGTSNVDSMHGVAVDSNGDGYIVGSFHDHTYFGVDSYNILNGQDGFVTKVFSNGSYDWVEVIGGNQPDNATAITVDSNDRVFLTGYYRGDVTLGTFNLENTGYDSTFVAEIDGQGNWLWGNEAKATLGQAIPFDIEVNPEGVYLGGAVQGRIELDGVTWWSNGTVANAYVALLDHNGTWLWSLNSSGHTQVVRDIAINPLGGVAAVGWFDMDHQYIANAYFSNHTVTEAPFGAFFAGVSPTGQWLWAESGGGMLTDVATSAAFTTIGNLIMAGRYCVGHDGSGCAAQIGTANYSSDSYMHGSGFVWSLNTDSDIDSIMDLNDNCPLVPNVNQVDLDQDGKGNLCDPDIDDDGRPNDSDSCNGPMTSWDSYDWSIDSDADGCRDMDEDSDDDADGIPDVDDLCSTLTTYRNWTSTPANDYDTDGCHDVEEDLDDDGDQVPDVDDDCAYAPSEKGWESSATTDYDGDGCKDDTEEDLDDDNDGINDVVDNCPTGYMGWSVNDAESFDYDTDGCHDTEEDIDDDDDGINDFDDQCSPSLPYDGTNTAASGWDSSGAQDLDKDGCRDLDEDDDDDSDGMADDIDQCPRGSVGWISSELTDNDGDGCRDSLEDQDDDSDSILDIDDGCPKGASDWTSTPDLDIDRDGCRDADEDWDDDGDGLWELDAQGNVIDQCPGTPLEERQLIDDYGCSPSQADDDGDGIGNSADACPQEAPPEGLDRDGDGCTDDIDQDGIPDDVDAFPDDPKQTSDRDGDGWGDNKQDSVRGDQCPDTPAKWIANSTYPDGSFGCAPEEFDFDEDGVLNGNDICPDTIAEDLEDLDTDGCGPHQRDADGDGTSDAEDLCPDTPAGESIVEKGCSESQVDYQSGGSSGGISPSVLAIIAIIVIALAGGAIAFFMLGRSDEPDIPQLPADIPAPEPIEEFAQDALEETTSGGDGITVDEDGTEWWEDEAGVWWYRTVSMDDWEEFQS